MRSLPIVQVALEYHGIPLQWFLGYLSSYFQAYPYVIAVGLPRQTNQMNHISDAHHPGLAMENLKKEIILFVEILGEK